MSDPKLKNDPVSPYFNVASAANGITTGMTGGLMGSGYASDLKLLQPQVTSISGWRSSSPGTGSLGSYADSFGTTQSSYQYRNPQSGLAVRFQQFTPEQIGYTTARTIGGNPLPQVKFGSLMNLGAGAIGGVTAGLAELGEQDDVLKAKEARGDVSPADYAEAGLMVASSTAIGAGCGIVGAEVGTQVGSAAAALSIPAAPFFGPIAPAVPIVVGFVAGAVSGAVAAVGCQYAASEFRDLAANEVKSALDSEKPK